MHNSEEQADGRNAERRSSGQDRITLATSLVIVAAVAAACALYVQIRRSYEAVPPSSTPVCPEVYATPAVLLWIILGSTATFAWRRCSITRLATQVAVACVLVMSRLSVPGGGGSPFAVFWPVACFGAFFVTPVLLCRFSRIGDSILVLADSSAVALLAYLFAVEPYIPKM